MQRRVFAANWKMNHGPTDAREFLREFLRYYPRHSDRQVLIFPASVALPALVEGLRDRPDVRVGIQNIHWEDKGAFTGEISPPMLVDLGCRLVLVGHSERRHLFHETDDEINKAPNKSSSKKTPSSARKVSKD